MEKKYIYEKILYIYDQFLELLLMEIRSLYEEYDEEDLDKFELKYREKYRNLVKKSLKENKVEQKVLNYFTLERDEYGLDFSENELEISIGDLFRNIGIELSVESLTIKEKWKQNQFAELKSELSRLSEDIKLKNSQIDTLNSDINNEKKNSKRLKDNLNKIEDEFKLFKLKGEETIKRYEEKIKITKKKNVELVKLSEGLNNEKNLLKTEIDFLKSKNLKGVGDINATVERYNKEIEHLKGGIESLRATVFKRNGDLERVESEKLDLEKRLIEKDEENKMLKEKLNKFNLEQNEEIRKRVNKAYSIEDLQINYRKIYDELGKKLRNCLRDMGNGMLEGKATLPMANEINKLAHSVMKINNIDEFNDALEELLYNLEEFDELFERNGKISGLLYVIKNLSEIKRTI